MQNVQDQGAWVYIQANLDRSLSFLSVSNYCCFLINTNDPLHYQVFDFHHLDPSTKIDNVSCMCLGKRKDSIILAEIAKCILLCANCHRLETIEQNKLKKNILLKKNVVKII